MHSVAGFGTGPALGKQTGPFGSLLVEAFSAGLLGINRQRPVNLHPVKVFQHGLQAGLVVPDTQLNVSLLIDYKGSTAGS